MQRALSRFCANNGQEEQQNNQVPRAMARPAKLLAMQEPRKLFCFHYVRMTVFCIFKIQFIVIKNDGLKKIIPCVKARLIRQV